MRQTEAWGTLAAAMQPFDAPGHLRVADNGDGAAIRRLTAAVLAEYGLVDDDTGDLDDIETAYVAGGGTFLVLVDGDRLLGCGGLLPLDGGRAELRRMYLVNDLRGKGLGKGLLQRLLDDARHAGFSSVELTTAPALVEAIGLYRRAGFRPADGAARGACSLFFTLSLANEGAGQRATGDGA